MLLYREIAESNVRKYPKLVPETVAYCLNIFTGAARRSSMASCVPVTDPSRLSDDRYHIRESLSRPPCSSQYKKRAGIPRLCSIFFLLGSLLIGMPQQYLVCLGRILVQCFNFVRLTISLWGSALVFVSRVRRQASYKYNKGLCIKRLWEDC